MVEHSSFKYRSFEHNSFEHSSHAQMITAAGQVITAAEIQFSKD
jgi:hypothetical protein